MKLLQPLLLVLAVLAGTSCSGSAAAPIAGEGDGPVFRFSAIPSEKDGEMLAQMQHVAEYLAEALQVRVAYAPVVDYGAAVEALKNGDVHLAWLGGVTHVQARDAIPGARAIAQGVVDPDYRSYFVAHVDSGLTPSEDFPEGLAGMRFAFGSRSSTSGRLMPAHFVQLQTGRSPDEFFGEVQYSGSHPRTAEGVQDGTWQAGALSYKTYDKLVATGEIDPAVCVKIWETPGYPDYNWTVRPDVEATFGDGFIARLQDALVSAQDPEVLGALQREEGLIPASNADFDRIEATMIQVGLLDG